MKTRKTLFTWLLTAFVFSLFSLWGTSLRADTYKRITHKDSIKADGVYILVVDNDETKDRALIASIGTKPNTIGTYELTLDNGEVEITGADNNYTSTNTAKTLPVQLVFTPVEGKDTTYYISINGSTYHMYNSSSSNNLAFHASSKSKWGISFDGNSAKIESGSGALLMNSSNNFKNFASTNWTNSSYSQPQLYKKQPTNTAPAPYITGDNKVEYALLPNVALSGKVINYAAGNLNIDGQEVNITVKPANTSHSATAVIKIVTDPSPVVNGTSAFSATLSTENGLEEGIYEDIIVFTYNGEVLAQTAVTLNVADIPTFVMVTKEEQIIDGGEYLIVCNNKKIALTTIGTNSGNSCSLEIANNQFTKNVATSADDANLPHKFKFSNIKENGEPTTKWTVQDALNNKYLAYTSSSKYLTTKDAPGDEYWTIKLYTEDGTNSENKSVSTGDIEIETNKTSGKFIKVNGEEFGLYTVGSTGQPYIQLYKLALPPCEKPTSLVAPTGDDLGITTAKVKWTASTSNPGSYKLEYWQKGAAAGDTLSQTVTGAVEYTLTGLSSSKQYGWRVSSVCATDNLSEAVTGAEFTTKTPTDPFVETTPAALKENKSKLASETYAYSGSLVVKGTALTHDITVEIKKGLEAENATIKLAANASPIAKETAMAAEGATLAVTTVNLDYGTYSDTLLFKHNGELMCKVPVDITVSKPALGKVGISIKKATLFFNPDTVTLTSPLAEAEVRYTLDGSVPTATSTLYTKPFAQPQSARIKALAFHADYASPVDSVTTDTVTAFQRAILPFIFGNGGSADLKKMQGVNAKLDNDYSGSGDFLLKFGTDGDYIDVVTNEPIGSIAYSLKGRPAQNPTTLGGTFTLSGSENGSEFIELKKYTGTEIPTDSTREKITVTNDKIRILRWYYEKNGGNIQFGNIAITAPEAPKPEIAIGKDTTIAPLWAAGSVEVKLNAIGLNLTDDLTIELKSNREGTFTFTPATISKNNDGEANGDITVTYTYKTPAAKDTALVIAKNGEYADTAYVYAESKVCATPEIHSATVTHNSIDISLDGEGARDYQFAYGKVETDVNAETAELTDRTANHILLSGLDQSTKYFYKIRAVCATGVYSDFATGNATTGSENDPSIDWVDLEEDQIFADTVILKVKIKNFEPGKEKDGFIRFSNNIGDTVITTDTFCRMALNNGTYKVDARLMGTDSVTPSTYATAFTGLRSIKVQLPACAKVSYTITPSQNATVAEDNANYYDTVTLRMTCATPGSKVYYTLNGGAKTEFTGDIKIGRTSTIVAHAEAERKSNGPDTTFALNFKVRQPVLTPVPATGQKYTDSVWVKMSCLTRGAKIYYTTGTAAPTAESTLWNVDSLKLTATTTLKAIAIKEGSTNSAVTTVTYTVNASPAPLPQGIAFAENFSGATSTSGWSGATSVNATNIDDFTDVDGWTLGENSSVGATLYALKFGSGKKQGIITTPKIDIKKATAGKFYVSFVAMRYPGDKDVTMKISVDGLDKEIELQGEAASNTSREGFKKYTYNFTSTKDSVQITFATTVISKRFILDSVFVYTSDPGGSESVEPVDTTAPALTVASSLTLPAYNAGDSTQAKLVVKGQNLTSAVAVAVNKTGWKVAPASLTAANVMRTNGDTVTVMYKGSALKDTADIVLTCGELTKTVKAYVSKILPTVGAITFTPAAGTYTDTVVWVKMSCATEGAAIRYTTDGTEPGANSTLFADSLKITETTTVKARGFKAEMNDGPVATAKYTLRDASQPVTGNTYNKVYDVAELTDGSKVLIVNEEFNTAASYPNALSGNTYLKYAEVEAGSDMMTAEAATEKAQDKPYEITIRKHSAGEGYVLYDSIYKLYYTHTKGGKNTITPDSLEPADYWTIEISSEGTATLVPSSETNYRIQYNSNVTQERFSCYTGSQKEVVLYKREGTGEQAAPVTEPTLTVNRTALTLSYIKGEEATAEFTVKGQKLTDTVKISVNGTGFSVQPAWIKDSVAMASPVTVTLKYDGSKELDSAVITVASTGAKSVTIKVNARAIPTYASLEDLYEAEVVATQTYIMTGKVVVTNKDSKSNRVWVQDIDINENTGASILVYQAGNYGYDSLQIGDVIEGLTGKLSLYHGLLELTPTVKMTATAHNHDVYVNILTVPTLKQYAKDYYQSAVVKLKDVKFVDAEGNFEGGQSANNYTLEDANGNQIVFRTDYKDADYLGTAIPTEKFTLTAIVAVYDSTVQITARSLADFEGPGTGIADAKSVQFAVYPNPNAGKFFVALEEEAVVEVYNAAGIRVVRKQVAGGVNEVALNVAGVYFVKVICGERASVKRVIVR